MMDTLLFAGVVCLLAAAIITLTLRLLQIEGEVERLRRQVWRLETTVEFGTEPQP